MIYNKNYDATKGNVSLEKGGLEKSVFDGINELLNQGDTREAIELYQNLNLRLQQQFRREHPNDFKAIQFSSL